MKYHTIEAYTIEAVGLRRRNLFIHTSLPGNLTRLKLKSSIDLGHSILGCPTTFPVVICDPIKQSSRN
jgi:hypothetical protein